MLAAIRGFAARGGVIYAECGGLMYLTDAIRTLDGARWPMAAIVPGVAVMSDRLQALGYVEVETRRRLDSRPCAARDFAAISFATRRSRVLENGDRFDAIYNVAPRWGGAPFAEGYRVGNVLASYVHAHWASNPAVAEALVGSCIRSRAARQPAA